MFNLKKYSCLFVIFFIIFIFSISAFSQNYIINGTLQNKDNGKGLMNSIVWRESLIIKDKRVYIHVVLSEGARHIADRKRYKNRWYLLPKEVVYDDASKRIYYYGDNAETEVGRKKRFLGLMPYISLAEGVKIVSSPTDAKLLISLDMTEKVYTNNCVPCHNPSKMENISLLYSKRRCKSIVDRMKEKEPSLFLSTDMDKLAGYLWEIKLRPYES